MRASANGGWPRVSRRFALKSVGAIAGAVGVTGGVRSGIAESQAAGKDEGRAKGARPAVCLFSKPLHNRPFAELPGLLSELGVDAVDLTCRPKGHVLPERVEEDLPRAHGLLTAAGITVPMITTGILDAGQGSAEEIIKTAAGLGIRYAKLGYYPYGDLHKLHQTLADVKSRVRDVAAMCKQYGMQAGFHNHAGNTVGAALWDVWHLIRDLPADAIGSYFDIRHATVEGGQHGWRIGMSLLSPRIIMAAVKDYLWKEDPKRGWRVENVQLGTGMVRCEEAFRRIKELNFTGPISLHMEYMAQGEHTPPIGSEQDKLNLASIRQDWAYLGDLVNRVGLT